MTDMLVHLIGGRVVHVDGRRRRPVRLRPLHVDECAVRRDLQMNTVIRNYSTFKTVESSELQTSRRSLVTSPTRPVAVTARIVNG